MMLQVGDDGVVTSVNEEELVYVDKNELEQLSENYQQLKKENEQLKQNIGIILKYCREKGKYAMDMKETKAHNVLQRILNEGDDGDD